MIAPGGAFTGLVHGGDGGFDTLEVTAAHSVAAYTATGPDSGVVTLDGVSFRYAGLEPVTSNADTTNLSLAGPTTDDDVVLEISGSQLKLTFNGNTAEDHTFDVPSASLTINLGEGNDTLTIKNVGPTLGAVALTINGGLGDDTVVFDTSTTFAGSVTVRDTDTITIIGGVTLTSTAAIDLEATRTLTVGAGATVDVNGADLRLAVKFLFDQQWNPSAEDFNNTQSDATLTATDATLSGANVEIVIDNVSHKFADFAPDVINLTVAAATTVAEESSVVVDIASPGPNQTLTRSTGEWTTAVSPAPKGFSNGQLISITITVAGTPTTTQHQILTVTDTVITLTPATSTLADRNRHHARQHQGRGRRFPAARVARSRCSRRRLHQVGVR